MNKLKSIVNVDGIHQCAKCGSREIRVEHNKAETAWIDIWFFCTKCNHFWDLDIIAENGEVRMVTNNYIAKRVNGKWVHTTPFKGDHNE